MMPTDALDKPNRESGMVPRLTMLWALSECGLGGFFHAFHSPFTGLFVGGLSVIFVGLIFYHARAGNPRNGPLVAIRSLAQSLIFVLAVKLSVSPHSPAGAYLAVTIQAILGMLIFSMVPWHRAASILHAIISISLSAVQKVVILTLIYGVALWEATDHFLAEISERLDHVLSFGFMPELESSTLVGAYIGAYALGGLLIGVVAGRLPGSMNRRSVELGAIVQQFSGTSDPAYVGNATTRKRSFALPVMVLFFLSIAFVLEYMFLSPEAAWTQLARTLSILVLWAFLLAPLFKRLLRKLLPNAPASATIREALPRMLTYARFAWHRSGGRGLRRFETFVLLLILYPDA